MEKSPIVRKGWLLVRQDIQTNVWSKHWFVLCGTSLSYYKDAKAEETNTLDGVIDVASAYEVSSIKAERNHGFRIKVMQPIRHVNITAYLQCNFLPGIPEIALADKLIICCYQLSMPRNLLAMQCGMLFEMPYFSGMATRQKLLMQCAL